MTSQRPQHEIDQDAVDFLDRILASGKNPPKDTADLRRLYDECAGNCPFVFESLVQQFRARNSLRASLTGVGAPSPEFVFQKLARRRSREKRSRMIMISAAASILILVGAGWLFRPGKSEDEVRYLDQMAAFHQIESSKFTPVDQVDLAGFVLPSKELGIVGHLREGGRDCYRVRDAGGEPATLIVDSETFEANPDMRYGSFREISESRKCMCTPHGECHVIYWNEGNKTVALVGSRDKGFRPLLDFAKTMYGSAIENKALVYLVAGE